MFGRENPETSAGMLPGYSKTGRPGNVEDLFQDGASVLTISPEQPETLGCFSRSVFEPRIPSENYTHPIMKPACGFEDFSKAV